MAETQTVTEPVAKKAPVLGFILSLIGGILIAVFAALIAANPMGIAMVVSSTPDGAKMIAEVGGIEVYAKELAATGILGLIFGVLVIIGAVLLKKGKRVAGGIMVIIFSVLSLFSGGGFWFIGMILGIIGGVLGLKGK